MASTLEGSGAPCVLVIAHDFPPNPSPQARRTGHMVLGLLTAGHRVRVLTRTMAPDWDASALPAHPNLEITCCPPDPVQGWVQRARHWRSGTQTVPPSSKEARATSTRPEAPSPLNWKGRSVAILQKALTTLGFPGASRAWLWHARSALRTLLAAQRPDCAVISHEPPAGLMLRRMLSRARVPFLLELGDPVCTTYTPKRWRRRALLLEADACRRASHIVVTCTATRDLLMARHGLHADRFSIIQQGFVPGALVSPQGPVRDPARLRLVYTGRLYAFRDPRPLFDAVRGLDMVELIVAAPQAHAWINVGEAPRNVQLLGELEHREALALQASADVLVNISNQGLPQVPGKFFEYLGMSKPLLHLTHGGSDEQAAMLASLRRGWSVNNAAGDIAALLARLASQHARGALVEGLDLTPDPIRKFAWPALASTFARLVERVAQRRNHINEETAWTLR